MSYENRYSYIPKIVLITGATGDFGAAFAHRYAALGCKLVLHGRSAEKTKVLAQELSSEYKVSVYEMVFDISDKEAMKKAFSSLPSDFADIDVLVNNAGLALGLEPAYKCSVEDWETMIEVNNLALVRMSRLVLEGMAQRKKGHIVNISSTAANYPYPGGNVYCATKAFVKQFSLALRADLAGTNIRVTNIEPGMVETQFSKVRFKGNDEKAGNVYAKTKNIHAEDIAEAVVWVTTLPPEMNINRMEIMPTVQSFGSNPVERFD